MRVITYPFWDLIYFLTVRKIPDVNPYQVCINTSITTEPVWSLFPNKLDQYDRNSPHTLHHVPDSHAIGYA